jgi:hypothetical protein
METLVQKQSVIPSAAYDTRVDLCKMVSPGIGDLIAITNGSENVAGLPFSAAIEPAPTSAEGDEGTVASTREWAPRPWGPWATVGWTLLCLTVMFVVQIAMLIILVVVHIVGGFGTKLESLGTNGDVLAVGTLASVPAVLRMEGRRYC